MNPQLSAGAIKRIAMKEEAGHPILQVISVKPIVIQNQKAQQTPMERYRLVLSDGIHFQQAMLATQLNDLVTGNLLQPDCIVRLNEFLCNIVQGRKIVIVLQLEVVSHPVPKIGDPQNIDGVPANVAQQPQPVSHEQPKQHQSNPYARPPSAAQYGAPPNGAGAGGGGAGESTFYPIKMLNPYMNRWAIKARVSSKGPVRTYSNARGEGKLLSVDFIDDTGGEIRATMFNDAVDVFDPLLQKDGVYKVARGQLKYKNKKFNSTPHDYEITLDTHSMVERVVDDGAIPSMVFSFCPLSEIVTRQANDSVDVIGVISAIADPVNIKSKTGKEFIKRTISIMDNSNGATTIDCTLWNEHAQTFKGQVGMTMAVKGGRISDFNGFTLSVRNETSVELDSDRKESVALKQWYQQGGSSMQPTMLSVRSGFGGAGGEQRAEAVVKTLGQIREEHLGHHTVDYVSATATIAMIRNDPEPWYLACGRVDESGRACQKKVAHSATGDYFCDKCSMPAAEPSRRYILSMRLTDHTGSIWATCFNEIGNELLGHTADELNAMKESGNDTAYTKVFDDATFQTLDFRIRAKSEMYNEESRVKYNVVRGVLLDYAPDSVKLLEKIAQY